MDSFAAFEEVLYLAKRFKCDMVLLAGDLFHENRPSRRTLYKTMEILRRYTMGPEAVQVQVLGDPNNVNYLNPFVSVDLPIFSIHGNHDDPTRDGGDLLAALDLLHVNLLVNYFGGQTEVSQVEIEPILLQKGSSRVALYGLGALREERLHRMWREGKVSFLRPEAEGGHNNHNSSDNEDEEQNESTLPENDFFNIFALHQNRDVGRGSKNCVQETMIPEWTDVVVWGHEHECQIDFTESVLGTFRITQPGSSVATSLVAGEAVIKKVGIMDVRGKNFRLHTVPLTQIRPFVTTEVVLGQHKNELDPEDNNIDTKVTRALEEEARVMMLNAKEKHEQVLELAKEAGSNYMEVIAERQARKQVGCTLVHPEKVLVRLRVEHSGFSTLNNQRFGAKFVDEIANSDSILLFHRKKGTAAGGGAKRSRAAKNIEKPLEPDELENTHMEDLVRNFLDAPNQKLKLLEEKGLSAAMEAFVEKSTTAAIPEAAKLQLKKKQQTLIKDKDVERKADIEEVMEEATRDQSTLNGEASIEDSRDASSMLDEDDEEIVANGTSTKAKKSTSRSLGRKSASQRTSSSSSKSRRSRLDDDDDLQDQSRSASYSGDFSMLDSDDDNGTKNKAKKTAKRSRRATEDDLDEIEVVEAPKKSGARSRRTASKKVNYSLDESEDEVMDEADGAFESRLDNESDDDVLIVDAPKKRKTSAKSRSTTTTKRGRAASSARKTGNRSKRSSNLDDDNENDFNGVGSSSLDLDGDWGSAQTRSQFH